MNPSPAHGSCDPVAELTGRISPRRCSVAALRIAIILALALLAFSSSPAQRAPADVIGATYLPADYIGSLFSRLPVDSARIVLQGEYTDAGFLGVEIAVDSAGRVVIEEGPRARIGTLSIEPQSAAAFLASETGRLPELAGEPFSTPRVDERLTAIVSVANERGYPLAVARLSRFDLRDSGRSVDLTIELDLGDRVAVDRIDVRGNSETDRDLIVTAAAVKPGEAFTDRLAQQVRSRLVRLNVFSEVAEPELYRDDSGRYGMLITVKEGNANTFDGVIGYQPPDLPDEQGTFTGLLNFAFRNMFGTGRKFAVRWQKQSKTSQELEVRYGEPFLFRFPLDVEFSFLQRQEAAQTFLPSYVQRNLAGDLYYGLTDAVSIRLGGAMDETIPEIDTTIACDRQLLNSRLLSTTVGILYDTRSHPLNPLTGVHYTTTYSVGAKQIRSRPQCDTLALGESETRQRLEVDMEGFVPLGRSFVVAGGLHGGEIRGDNLEESDLFRFGGQGTVRGYRENLIRASRRAWSTAEVRLLLADLSYAAIFFDGGYYLRPLDRIRDLPQFEEWIFGYGVGAQIETPLGLVRISFALGKGDTFETGKVYVGLVNQF